MMTEVIEDVVENAERFTSAFYQGEPGHCREQFKRSLAAMLVQERARGLEIAAQIADDVAKEHVASAIREYARGCE